MVDLSGPRSGPPACRQSPGFDYVIVGAGSAGCALAARLTRGRRGARAPARGRRLGPRSLDPHPARLGQDPARSGCTTGCISASPRSMPTARQVECARGKVVGGSSSTNAMALCAATAAITTAGRTAASPAGPMRMRCPISASWSAGKAARTPIAAATARSPRSSAATRTRCSTPIAEAGRTAGYAWTDDYNGAQQEGFGRLQMTIRNGRRCSAATAYLRPALEARRT